MLVFFYSFAVLFLFFWSFLEATLKKKELFSKLEEERKSGEAARLGKSKQGLPSKRRTRAYAVERLLRAVSSM